MRVLRLVLGTLVCCGSFAVLAVAADPVRTDAERQKMVQRLVAATQAAEAAEAADQLAEARKFRQEAFDLHVRVQGEEHWQTGDARRALAHVDLLAKLSPAQRKELAEAGQLNGMVLTLYAQGKINEALPLAERVRAIRTRLLGEAHPHTITSANNLAAIWEAQGKFTDAITLHREVLALRLKTIGENHPETATSYNNLGEALVGQGKYAEAETYRRQALAIRRKTLGEENTETARDYNNLGHTLVALGKYAEAEPLFRQALAIRRKLLGVQHPDTAASYYGLALQLQHGQGKYGEAEALYRQALAIWQKTRGEEFYNTGIAYNELASCLDAQGKYAEAAPLHEKALFILRKVRGEEHPETARVRNFIVVHLYARGMYAEAERYARTVLEVRRKVLGDEHPDTAQAYNNMAAILKAQDKYLEAAELMVRATASYQKHLGDEHPQTLGAYGNLAALLYFQSNYEEAEAIQRKVLSARTKTLDAYHPDTALASYQLALTLHAQGKSEEAEKMAGSAAAAFQVARLRAGASGLDRAAFSAERSPLPLLAILLARRKQPARAWHRLEENLGRGLLDDLSGYQRLARPDRDRLRSLLARLQGLDEQLAALPATATGPTDPRAQQLRGQRDALQKELADFREELAIGYGVAAGQVYDLARIQARLPATTALVAWVDLKWVAAGADPRGDHWVCVVRRTGTPVWAQLTGSGLNGAWTADDESLPERTRQAFVERRPVWHALARKLAEQRLAPVERHLRSGGDQPVVTHLMLLPSPGMAGVPVEALTDRYRISYVPSGTMFAWLQEQQEERKKLPGQPSLLALGDPDFLAQPGGPPEQRGSVLHGQNFQPLPGSRREVEAIAELFVETGGRVKKLLGSDASERQLDRLAQDKELENYRYLHLATHGKADGQRGLASYLALTREQAPGPSTAKRYDGRLTAAQILHSWTLNADLVSLSACETGLGQNQGSEGYLGFAQALFLAGSRSLVLSLWQVDDQATGLLMTRFYQNLLGKRPGLNGAMPKAAALAEAKIWLRGLTRAEIDSQPLVSRSPLRPASTPNRPEGPRPYEHPHYWAGFILVGDPGAVEPVVAAAAAPTATATPGSSWSAWPWLLAGIVPLGIVVAVVVRRRRLLLEHPSDEPRP